MTTERRNTSEESNTAEESNFQKGLNNIINSYEIQLGRKLQEEETSLIADQARKFYDEQRVNTEKSNQSNRITDIDGRDPTSLPGGSARSIDLDLNPSSQDQINNDIATSNNDLNEQDSSKPPLYPMNFYQLAQLISSPASIGKTPHQLCSLLSNQTNLPGLKTIPDKLNDQKPSEPILAHQTGAGRKPWESRLDEQHQSNLENH